jgi:hypothetical protein
MTRGNDDNDDDNDYDNWQSSRVRYQIFRQSS